MIIITNNPWVIASYPKASWVEGTALDVLFECRKSVHKGYSLLAHPFMGDIHLLANPFRTVILGDQNEEIDLLSLRWIEESIAKVHSASSKPKGEDNLEDYQTVDFELFKTVIPGATVDHKIRVIVRL